NVAGSGRRLVRQWQTWSRCHRRGQQATEIVERHAQRKGWPFSPELAWKTRRLLRPLRDRDWARAKAASMRIAEGDGIGTVRDIHHPAVERSRIRTHRA